MPSPDDHIQTLEKELDLLRRVVTAHKNAVTELNLACREIRAEFDVINKKHAQLTRAFEGCRTDLWLASSRMDRKDATRQEGRMVSVVEEQVKIQRRLPQMYKRLGEMVGAREAMRESVREYKDKMARKVEEIHTLRPCQSLVCAHCGRGGAAAALQKVKVSFRDRVARVWRAG
ncbi:hypothetical protein UCDDA912_g06813 [Diaporthe ampelina]|uniref:Uncharacterized protein n=1 Tax=Diaporthe ampelina TaxID=1214573 RepID=A0A0G2FGG7_9PEZI|nr:hypothetical protein UCDDA912_g06813 [Diaporthe ampelina]